MFSQLMTTAPVHPMLRLVGTERVSGATVLRSGNAEPLQAGVAAARADRVAAENASAAATMSALDPRWVLAVQVYRELKTNGSGVSAIITPEARRRLLLVGQRLGLRAFDSHMVVAIVQDHTRAGEDPLGREAQARLGMIQSPDERIEGSRPTWGMVAGLVAVSLLTGATIGAIVMVCLLR
jgi:hypothetical protein